MYLDEKIKIHSRQTYSFLEFLSDLGGLFEALKLIAGVFVNPFSALALKVSILSSIFIRLTL